MRDGSLIPRLRRARRDPQLAVLEGLHAIKHALRFGADVRDLLTPDFEALLELTAALAPDLRDQIAALAHEVDREVFDQLAPLPPSTGAIAIAERPAVDAAAALRSGHGGPVVLLEDPRDLGNIGACVRVAAAADSAAVLTTGSHDPWHPDALRGAAGLHFALPVARLASVDLLAQRTRTLLALDPDGVRLQPHELGPDTVLAFGTERHGLSEELAALADRRVRIPMRAGVSSLNLATSVSAVLFAWRLAGG